MEETLYVKFVIIIRIIINDNIIIIKFYSEASIQ